MAYYSNSSEGAKLDWQCSECKYGDEPCPIALAQMEYNYEQVGNEIATAILNTIVSKENGCEMFTQFDDLQTPVDVIANDFPIETGFDRMKLEHLQKVFNKYTFEQIEKLLPE